MATIDPGVELLEAFRVLTAASRELSWDVGQPLARHKAPLGHLEAAVRSLGQVTSPQPPHRVEEYVQQWEDLLRGRRLRLDRRAVRYLCWEPDVATDGRFLSYLDGEYADLSRGWLQGLVRSCHTHWSPEFVTGPSIKKVQRRLANYQGTNPLLLRWKDASSMILGPSGQRELAAYMIENLHTIKACCDEWGVDEQTQYVIGAVRQVVRYCHEGMGRSSIFGHYLLDELLPWAKWPLSDFKAEVGATILHPAVAEIREPLTNLILRDTRLGDPRLNRNTPNWISVPEEARFRFIQQLSRADIAFFFEHVLPHGGDPHGRKAFWLRYVPSLRMSRPLLYQSDQARLRHTMQEIKEQIGHFGRMSGSTSAFLLHFGSILVIEFSRVGNACYVYPRGVLDEVVPDFWTSRPFRDIQLRQSHQPHERVVHRRGWQEEMARILAQHGIRAS